MKTKKTRINKEGDSMVLKLEKNAESHVLIKMTYFREIAGACQISGLLGTL